MSGAIEKTSPNSTGTQARAGVVARQEFGAQQIAVSGEVAQSGVQARELATVQARFIVALQRPRDMDEVRLRLLKECRRPGFASVARYRKPIGKGIEGPSIRFVEAALRAMGNVSSDTTVIYDDSSKRIVKASVTDLESNTSYEQEAVIEKAVERKKVQDGQIVIRERRNSYGDRVYLVEATDDDLLNKQGALVSKAIRTLGLRVIPGDLVEEGQQICKTTLENEASRDPDASRKQLVDAFAGVGVRPQDLKAYLGHDLDAIPSAELVELRSLFNAVKEGETTWREALDSKTGRSNQEAVAAPVQPAQGPAATPAAAVAGPQPTSDDVEPTAGDPVQDEFARISSGIDAATTLGELMRFLKAIMAAGDPGKTLLQAAYERRRREITEAKESGA